jgi:hypothetical protein
MKRSHHYQHLFTLLLQANCPMNVDGEHLSSEQVHEMLNWRLFSFSLHYNNERLSELLLQRMSMLLLLLLLMHTILVYLSIEVCYLFK